MIRLCPVISSGLGTSIRSSSVGAISHSLPSSMRRQDGSALTSINGTGLVVCDVLGCPVSSSNSDSALPWSATISMMPSASFIACSALPTHSSTVSTALMTAGSTPVCPTMSALAKFTTIKSYSLERIASHSLSHSSYALISGFMSYVGTLGDGTSSHSSPSRISLSPPLKKYVTCAYFSVSAV